MSPTDTKRRLFICFLRLGKKVTKMCFSKGEILWRFVIKICLIKCSTEVIGTQWPNFLQDPRISSWLFIKGGRKPENPVKKPLSMKLHSDQSSSYGDSWSDKLKLFGIFGNKTCLAEPHTQRNPLGEMLTLSTLCTLLTKKFTGTSL